MKAPAIFLACVLCAGCAGTPAPTAPSGAREIAGTGATVRVVEDFDRGPSEIQLSRHVDAWGEHVKDTRSAIDIVDAGSGGKAARFSFTSTFDSPFSLPAWKDTGLAFVGDAELPAPAAGDTGIALGFKPEGFTRVVFILVQEDPAGTRAQQLSLSVNEGAWKDWRLPFSAFRTGSPGDRALDLGRPLRLEIYVPWQDNWDAWSFRSANGAAAAFSIDTLGYWRATAKDDSRTVEGWEDERDTLPFTVDLYGASLWTDYAASEEGIVRANDGVTGEMITLGRQPGGPEGTAFMLNGRLDLARAITAFHKAGQSLSLYLKAPVSAPLAGAKALSFLVRSDLLQRGTLEIQDEGNDRYYQAEFSVIGSWARVRIPFEKLLTEKGTLAGAETISDRVNLQMAFELPTSDVDRAAEAGVLQFVLGLDSFALER